MLQKTALLCFDPGERTGFALFIFPNLCTDCDSEKCEHILEEPVRLIMHKEIYGGIDAVVDVFAEKNNPLGTSIAEIVKDEEVKNIKIVAEDFIPWADKNYVNYTPLEIKGALKFASKLLEIPIIIQSPAGRKEAVSDDALKNLDWYLAGEPNRNAREAIRHGVVYLKNERNRWILKEGWPRD